MYKVSLDAIKIKNCHVVTLTGEAIRCYTLPKGDLGATTAKRQLLCVSRHINPVAGCRIADALNNAQISNLGDLGSITGMLNDHFNFDENNLSATESDSDSELQSVSDGSIEVLPESVDSLTNPDQVNLVRVDNCSNNDDDASGVVEEANPEEETEDVDEMDELMEKVATFFLFVNSDRSVELPKISSYDCKCSDSKRGQCMKALDPECIYDIRLSMQEMTRHKRDLVLLGKISSCTEMSDKTQCSKRKMQTDRKQPQSTWIIHGTKVCRIAFLFINNISNDKLSNVMKWYKENGLVPRFLKSGGRREVRPLSHSDIVSVASFKQIMVKTMPSFCLVTYLARRTLR